VPIQTSTLIRLKQVSQTIHIGNYKHVNLRDWNEKESAKSKKTAQIVKYSI
jgi:hypothetical protein